MRNYRKISNIRRTLVGNKIVDHSDVVGASNYIFILDLTSGFKGFVKDSRKTVRESYKCWDLVRLILETWRYIALVILVGLVCYVTAAPRRPIRSPVMGRVPNHEGPHPTPHPGPHHRRPKVSNFIAKSRCLVIMPHITFYGTNVLPTWPDKARDII